MARKWRCVVCGYIEEAEGPPDICPVCGATRDYFEPWTPTDAEGNHGGQRESAEGG